MRGVVLAIALAAFVWPASLRTACGRVLALSAPADMNPTDVDQESLVQLARTTRSRLVRSKDDPKKKEIEIVVWPAANLNVEGSIGTMNDPAGINGLHSILRRVAAVSGKSLLIEKEKQLFWAEGFDFRNALDGDDCDFRCPVIVQGTHTYHAAGRPPRTVPVVRPFVLDQEKFAEAKKAAKKSPRRKSP